MTNLEDLQNENKRLKDEVKIYQNGYENLLTEKLIVEQEYENYKQAIEESQKIKNPGIFGSTTVLNFQKDNIKYKSEIDEYLNTIWELQTNLSLKEEENRYLMEKIKQLENEKENLQNNINENNKDKDKEKENEPEKIEKSNIGQSILNMDDLYRSTVIQKTNVKIKKILKETININVITEEEMEKKREEEEEKEKERKRKEEEEFERKKKEEEEKQRKILEEKNKKKELENKINEFNNKIINLEEKLEELKNKNNEFYTDIQNQNIYINNYKTFINDLNEEINKLKDKIKINFYDVVIEEEGEGGEGEGEEKVPEKNKKIIEFVNILETISVKVRQYNDVIDDSKNNKLKSTEKILTEIQEKLNEINKEKNNSNLITLKNIYEINLDFVSNKINELENTVDFLQSNKQTYEKSKKEIEEEIDKLKKSINDYLKNIEKILPRPSKIQQGPKIDSIFLRGSMLLGVNDFGKENDIFRSTVIFKEDDYENNGQQDLLRKNWNEVCYVYDEYDIHDVNYIIKAVGLPNNSFFSSASVGFYLDTDVVILVFEVDGKKKKYDYSQYSLTFNIRLRNLQTNKIHLKYKESPLKSKMTEGEKKERKFVKNQYYGISKNVAGQNAKFTLSIKCDFEVISFEDNFFIKTKEKEYTWGGKVPPTGKRTLVKMSKTKGKFNFNYVEAIKSRNSNPIKSTKMTVPVSFVGGNNEIIKIDCKSEQTDNVTLKPEIRAYEINFLNTNSTKGEFKMIGELINRCKGEWICDLTDKQIEEAIPNDYKTNKNKFKDFAEKIIKDYDEKHKDDAVKVPDVVKIGQWIKKI